MFKITGNLIATLAFVLLSFSAVVQAEEHDRRGWYVSGKIGINSMGDMEYDITGNPSRSGESGIGDGFPFISVALGHQWRNFRVEGEIFWGENDIDSFTYASYGNLDSATLEALNKNLEIDGEITERGFMANLWYDFDTQTRWSPYIGGGVGVVSSAPEYSFRTPLGQGQEDPDNDLLAAFQIGAGLGYKLNESTILELSYRFRYNDGSDFYLSNGGRLEADSTQNHVLLVGIRFNLY